MPRYNATVDFTLTTEIEPDGVRFDYSYPDSVSEFEDSSYFQTNEVDSTGGSLSFVIQADSEDEAQDAISEFISEGSEVEDNNGYTWLIRDVGVDLEEIEEPMTREKAEAILIGLAEGRDPEVKEAVEFIFDVVSTMEARIAELSATISTMHAEVERLRPGAVQSA